jgi:thioredoxin reductase
LPKKLANVEILKNVDVESIDGDVTVKSIKLNNGTSLKVDGVFIILEHVSTTDILTEAGIKIDERGCIIIDRENATNIKGVFAAGDCICGGMQIVMAAGDGGRAGLSALRYVKSLKNQVDIK